MIASARSRVPPARYAGLMSLLAAAVLLVLWEVAARAIALDAFPPAHQAIAELPALVRDREALADIGGSLWRMAAGFALAVFIAAPLGICMGRSRAIAAAVNPVAAIFYPIPKAALMPLLLLWLGVGDASKVFVIFLATSLPLLYHSQQGARSVDEKIVWSAMAMGVGRMARLFRIILPAALPEILIGCRVALTMSLIVMVTSEMIARESGAGNILFNSLDMAIYPLVYAMILIIGVIGFLIDAAFERVRAHLVRWAESAEAGALPLFSSG